MLDTDNNGTITFEELKLGLNKVGSNLMESEIKELMDAVSFFFLICISHFSKISCSLDYSDSLTSHQ